MTDWPPVYTRQETSVGKRSHLGSWPSSSFLHRKIGHVEGPGNQCCGSGMFIPDPGSDFFPSRIMDPNFFHPGSRIRIKVCKFKKMVLSSRKYDPGCSSRIRMTDPDPDFLPIPDPGSRGQKGTGTGIWDPGSGAFLTPGSGNTAGNIEYCHRCLIGMESSCGLHP